MERESYLVYTIDAFAKVGRPEKGTSQSDKESLTPKEVSQKLITKQKTGNPAGFVDLRGEGLDADKMQAIAKMVGFSETAFIETSKEADFKVRFFTPSDEVDLCGHATIGLFSGMYQLGLIPAGSYQQKTKAGILKVQIGEDASVLMEQAKPIFGETIVDADVAKSLSLTEDDLSETLPCQAVSTGLLDLLIPVKDLSVLSRIVANDALITEVSKRYGVVGYHVFAIDEVSENGIKGQCRNFAPLYAIPEEAATGTSNGALAAYCKAYNIGGIGAVLKSTYTFRQGIEMNCPSEIRAQIDEKGRVWVGGIAANLNKRVIKL